MELHVPEECPSLSIDRATRLRKCEAFSKVCLSRNAPKANSNLLENAKHFRSGLSSVSLVLL